jgi:hypothetical protein
VRTRASSSVSSPELSLLSVPCTPPVLDPVPTSAGDEEGTTGSMLLARGRIPERRLRVLSLGTEDARGDVWSSFPFPFPLLFTFLVVLSVEVVEFTGAVGLDEPSVGRGTSVV